MQYSVVVLGATGNVGGRIVQLLIKNPLCKKLVVVTRRKTDVFAAPKVFEVIVNMDQLEEEVAPYAQGVDVALAAFGVGKAARRCPRRRCARLKSPTRRPFAAPLRLEALVCGGS
jgi:NADPH:quinone reductase-like Zn-dependent oxidoreductase